MADRIARGRPVRFEAELWLYQGDAPWHFLTLPADVADTFADGPEPRAGFGSVRVVVSIGEVDWSTSIFPDAKSKSFVLPIKKEVRRQLGLSAGDVVAVTLRRADDR